MTALTALRNGCARDNSHRNRHTLGVYIPQAFREERPEVLQAFIARHPLGALICTTPDGLTANHIPMMLIVEAGRSLLRGHVARANDVWKSLVDRKSVV